MTLLINWVSRGTKKPHPSSSQGNPTTPGRAHDAAPYTNVPSPHSGGRAAMQAAIPAGRSAACRFRLAEAATA